MKKIRNYVLPVSATDGDGSDSGMGALDGLLGQQATDQGSQDNSQDQMNQEGEQNTDPGADQNAQDNQQQSQQQIPNRAFAQMRVQNQTYLNALKSMATSMGIQYTDTDDLMNKLQTNTLEKQSKEMNVPPELLQRLNNMEQMNQKYIQDQRQQTALQGFQAIQQKYELSEQELQSFAAELDEQGKNPFMDDLNVEELYKVSHFEDILSKQVDKAVRAVLTKDSNVSQHSSTPNNAQGQGTQTGDQKVSTVSALTAAMDQLSQK